MTLSRFIFRDTCTNHVSVTTMSIWTSVSSDSTWFVAARAVQGLWNRVVFQQGEPWYPMAHMFGLGKDFDDDALAAQPALKKAKGDSGEPRIWLKIFETCPAQLSNAYGMSQVVTLPDDKAWAALSKRLATGAIYDTQLASQVIISQS